ADRWRTFFLGDLVDYGMFGVGCLRFARDRDNTEVLLGNHEAAMLWALRDPARIGFWISVGGQPHDLDELRVYDPLQQSCTTRPASCHLRPHAPPQPRPGSLPRRQGDQLRRRPVAGPPPASARRSDPGERGSPAGLGHHSGPTVLARPVSRGVRLLLAVELDDVLLLGRPAVVAGGEAEHLRAAHTFIPKTRAPQLLQPCQLHPLEREDVLLRLRPAPSGVAVHTVRPDHAVALDEVR